MSYKFVNNHGCKPATHNSQKSRRARNRPNKSSIESTPYVLPGWELVSSTPSSKTFPSDVSIGEALQNKLDKSDKLESSFKQAAEEILQQFPDSNIQCLVEIDREDSSSEYPTLRVKIEVDSIDDWQTKRDLIKQIVRNAEIDDTMIYTDVIRKQ